MKKLIIFESILILFFVLAWNVSKADEIIQLVCDYEKTWDLKTGETSSTSGSTSVVIELYETSSDNTFALIDSSNVICSILGRYSESEIYGDCEKEYDGMTIKQSVKINRFSGEYTESLSVVDRPGGLIHFGTCNASKRKF